MAVNLERLSGEVSERTPIGSLFFNPTPRNPDNPRFIIGPDAPAAATKCELKPI